MTHWMEVTTIAVAALGVGASAQRSSRVAQTPKRSSGRVARTPKLSMEDWATRSLSGQTGR